jgi:hypothetical protein
MATLRFKRPWMLMSLAFLVAIPARIFRFVNWEKPIEKMAYFVVRVCGVKLEL